MSDSTAQTRDPSLDAANVVAEEYPRREPGELIGLRTRRFQTIIKQSVLNEIHDHGQSSLDAEICGVLVGDVYHDDFGPYLYIHASIRGDSAEGRAAQVTFKAETWTHIQTVMERDHPDARIVGWYHTHPGFGIFLSGMDLFIQDNFFNLPWQAALVYDPKSGDEGVFVWRSGTSEREAHLIEPDVPASAQAGIEAQNDCTPPPKDEYATAGVWIAAVVAFVVSFGATMAVMYRPWEAKPAPVIVTSPGQK
jgi:proteasome lid subunit RPN8/RPN11